MLGFMLNVKTSLAAQRAAMFKEQGFKNMFVKVFYEKPNYFPIKMTIKFSNYHFPQNTLILP